MFNNILVCGAGAIGGTVAAFLVRAGHRISIVDAAPAHVAAIRKDGLSITGPVAQFRAPCDAYLPSELAGEFDLVLLAVKGYQTETAISALKSHLSSTGTIVSLQNGLNELRIAELVGASRTLGCFIHFGADYLGPGKIAYVTPVPMVLGELDGRMSERLRSVHALLRDFDPHAQMTDNIFGYLWSKLSFGAINVTQALSNRPTQEFLDDPRYRPMIRQLIMEIASVADAEGVALTSFGGFDATRFVSGDAAAMDRTISDYANRRRGSTKTHTGVWQDLMVHKRRSETMHQYRPVIDIAVGHGIAVPTLEAAVGLIEEVESGRRALTGEQAVELLAMVLGESGARSSLAVEDGAL